jgi:hypothetical protein
MVASAQVRFTAGGASDRLEAPWREDGMLALDSTLRCDGDADDQVIGGLLVAVTDLPLVRTAIDRPSERQCASWWAFTTPTWASPAFGPGGCAPA